DLDVLTSKVDGRHHLPTLSGQFHGAIHLSERLHSRWLARGWALSASQPPEVHSDRGKSTNAARLLGVGGPVPIAEAGRHGARHELPSAAYKCAGGAVPSNVATPFDTGFFNLVLGGDSAKLIDAELRLGD